MRDLAYKVKAVIIDALHVASSQVVEEAQLYQLGAGEIGMIEIIMGLEREFDIVVPEEDMMQLSTVGEVIEYVRAHTPV